MSVQLILNLAGAKMGLNPSLASQRAVLLRFLNEAAEELYDQSDPIGSLAEQVFKVNGDQTISCPWYVGKIRAVREADTHLIWSVNKMRPHYNQFSWKDMWRNLRLRNTQALMCTVTNQSIGIISVPFVENPPIQVTVSGPTASASNASETITMTALSLNTTNDFLDYTSVKKDRVNNCDVTLSDVDGKTLTIIPNNQLEALYQIIDVSTCPWLSQSSSTLDHYLEILFKKTLPILTNDTDEYPVPKHDYILVNKIMQLWQEEQGKPDLAMAYDTKATRGLARKMEDQEKPTQDEVSLVSNPHDTLLPRIGRGYRRYFGRFGGQYNGQ